MSLVWSGFQIDRSVVCSKLKKGLDDRFQVGGEGRGVSPVRRSRRVCARAAGQPNVSMAGLMR